MKNTTVVAILLTSLFLTPLSYAGNGSGNEGNGLGNGGSESGSNPGQGQGTQGPQGPKGDPGANGKDGSNGTNGVNGANGTNGTDASSGYRGTALVGDFALRLYDGKRVQLQAFDIYTFGSHPGDDVFGQGYNSMIGARVVLKLGSSYEERKLAEQQKVIDALKAMLLRK